MIAPAWLVNGAMSWLFAAAVAPEAGVDVAHALDTVPIAVPPAICPFFTSQVSTSPVVVLRHSTSLTPSPLKSPIPANCQALDTELTPVPPVTCPLPMSQVSTSPVFLLSHRTSLVPSLLKSPLPSRVQAL